MNFTKLAATFVNPISKEEDARRREFILNVLLLSLITLLTVATVSSVIFSFFVSTEEQAHNAMPIIEILSILGLFIALYFFTRKGFARVASYIFIGILILFVVDLACSWGPDLPTAILFYALIIAISGILVDSRFAFIVALLLGVIVATVSYLQEHGLLRVDTYWRSGTFSVTDSFIIWIILMIIATISWLSNREIERSLVRARNSEAELKTERDSLEMRVEERTSELRKAEMERMNQSYRFIEFGRLASGVFHDLTNPLTSISLTIENILSSNGSGNPLYASVLMQEVNQAKRATNHMQNLLGTMRRHLMHESSVEQFLPARLIEDVLSMLCAYARQRNVELVFDIKDAGEFRGSPVAFTQIITNLISNAVESFPQEARTNNRNVTVSLQKQDGGICILIQDTGSGIPEEIIDKVFEPFMSTKSSSGGLGIGLSLVKQLVEQEFDGNISVTSEISIGTKFTVQLPAREP